MVLGYKAVERNDEGLPDACEAVRDIPLGAHAELWSLDFLDDRGHDAELGRMYDADHNGGRNRRVLEAGVYVFLELGDIFRRNGVFRTRQVVMIENFYTTQILTRNSHRRAPLQQLCRRGQCEAWRV